MNLAAGHRVGFNPDESRWIHRAHLLRDLRDPFGPTWDNRYETRGQPPLGSYATGLGLLIQGRDLETNGPWNYAYQGTRGWYQNIADGNMPSPADLAAARRTSALLAALTAVGVFALLLRLSSLIGATVGSLALALHPFNAYIGGIATADALLGLLLVLTALAAARLGDQPTWGAVLLLGGLLGLGGATKLSPLLVSLPLAALGGLLLIRSSVRPPLRAFGWRGRSASQRPFSLFPHPRKENGTFEGPHPPTHPLAPKLLTLPLVAALTFVAVYPYLWPDPIGRTHAIFAFRAAEMANQAGDWPEMAVTSRAEAIRRVGVNFHDRFSYANIAHLVLERATGLSWRPPAVELCLSLAGALVFAAAAARGGPSPTLLVFILLGSQVGVTLAGMRSEFDRYHVPMALAGAVGVGILCDRLVAIAGSSIGLTSLPHLAIWRHRPITREPRSQAAEQIPPARPKSRLSP